MVIKINMQNSFFNIFRLFLSGFYVFFSLCNEISAIKIIISFWFLYSFL
jgi:hypothetical protein